MKFIAFLWIFLICLQSYAQTNVGKFAMALEGDYASALLWDNSVYSGGVSFRYTSPKGNRRGIGGMFTYAYLPRSYTAYKVHSLAFPVFFEKPFLTGQGYTVYLSSALVYHHLLKVEPEPVINIPDVIWDPFWISYPGDRGIIGRGGINIRKSLGKAWAINVFPYIQYTIVEFNKNRLGPDLGKKYTAWWFPLESGVLERTGIQIGLERNLSREIVRKNWKRGDASYWEIGLLLGDETGIEASFGEKWRLGASMGYYSLLRPHNWESPYHYVSYKHAFAYSLGIRRRFPLKKSWKFLTGLEMNIRTYYNMKFVYDLNYPDQYHFSEKIRFMKFPAILNRAEYHQGNLLLFGGIKYIPFYTTEYYPRIFYAPVWWGDVLLHFGLALKSLKQV